MLESIFTFKAIIEFFLKVSVLFSLVIVVNGASTVGLVDLVTRPFDKFKRASRVLVCWYVVSFLLTGIIPNVAAASILLPLGFYYAKSRNLNINAMLLTIAFGTSVGNDLSPYGGGMNFVTWQLLSAKVGYTLDLSVWFRLFWPTTISAIILTGLILWFTVLKRNNDYLTPILRPFNYRNWRFIVITIISAVILFNTLTDGSWQLSVLCAGLTVLVCKFDKGLFKTLPWKVLYLWSFAFFFGKFVGIYLKAHPELISYFNIDYSLLTVTGLVSVLSIITNLMPNGAVTAIATPFALGLPGEQSIWLYVLIMKALSFGLMTICADVAVTLCCSFGLPQRQLFKIGTPVVIINSIFIIIYFYLTRNVSWLYYIHGLN